MSDTQSASQPSEIAPPASPGARRPGDALFGVTERELSVGLRGRLQDVLQARSRLELLAALHTGPRLLKFQHYYRIYDGFFRKLRGRPLTVLEVGVGYGGSLVLWRRYFGGRARIVGVDFRPECREHERNGVTVEIGDQNDREFLDAVARRHGPFDIVIDDGSHAYDHQRNTFEAFFPRMKEGGIYACEDICSSYWSELFGGGCRAPHNFVETLKTLIDEQNGWFWREGFAEEEPSTGLHLHSMHFFPALVVIEKRRRSQPEVVHVGKF